MCKNGGLLVAYDYAGKRALMARADCDSWKCDECKEKLRFMWVRRAEHGTRVLQERGEVLYFATITSHEQLTSFAQTAYAFPDCWKKLHKRLGKGQYLLVPEKHEDERLHMHAIWNYPVNTRWLKDEGRACGFGFMNQIGRRGHKDEPITDVGQVGEYVSKYLGKDLGAELPARFRRIRTSQDWPQLEAVNNMLSVLEWQFVANNWQLQLVYLRCTADKLTLVDAKTGEMFDDIDLDNVV